MMDLQPDAIARKTAWTVAELLDADLPEIPWVVPDILPVGLTILGGRPKVGKSWLCLQTAAAAGTGGMLLNKRAKYSPVLYLALEDSTRRLKQRITDMQIPRDADMRILQEFPPFTKNGGGIARLEAEIAANHFELVILDTISRLLPGVDQGDPTIIGPIYHRLQKITMDTGAAIITVDHLRKPGAFLSDPVDDVLESTAKTAAADNIMALTKVHGKLGASLRGRGRDSDELDMRLVFDNATHCWQPLEGGDARDQDRCDSKVIRYIQENGAANTAKIAKALALDYGNLHRTLQEMVNDGLLSRSGTLYSVVDDGIDDDT